MGVTVKDKVRASVKPLIDAAELFGTNVGCDEGDQALPDDGTGMVVEGKIAFERRESIFTEDLLDKLDETQKAKLVNSSEGKLFQGSVFILTAVMGALVPLATQYSKDYPSTYKKEVEGGWQTESCAGLEHTIKECGQAMLYAPTVQLFLESMFSLSVGLAITHVVSGKPGIESCFKVDRLKMTAPIAFIYAVGDLIQLVIIGRTSASFFIIVGQLKLIGVAILTQLVLGRGQTTVQWLMLLAITLVSFLYCDLEMAHQGRGGGEVAFVGLVGSLAKVFLSAFNSVLTERAFKAAPNEAIWVNQVQLKLCSVPFSLMFVILTDLLYCSGDTCLLRAGPFHDMGLKVALLTLTQAIQNFVVGLVYKKVNAVVKYLATAQSLWIVYVAGVLLAGGTLYFDLSCVVVLMVVVVIAYSMAKATPPPKPPVEAGPLPMVEMRAKQ